SRRSRPSRTAHAGRRASCGASPCDRRAPRTPTPGQRQRSCYEIGVTLSRIAVAVAVLGVVFTSPATGARKLGPPVGEPVPSLTPVATQKLWEQLVANPVARPSALSEACVPVRAVFYAATDWRRLATKLAASPSPCAQYYVSVPPVGDKTQPRSDEAWRIRAL